MEQTESILRLQTATLFTFGHRKAATLSGLARKLGVSASGLAATVDAYNAAITSGGEDPAHKAAELCAPIRAGTVLRHRHLRPPVADLPGARTHPRRASRSTARPGWCSMSTAATIPGLYAAGRTAVGICSNSYVSGLALADCVFSGRRAGEHAASADTGEPTTWRIGVRNSS